MAPENDQVNDRYNPPGNLSEDFEKFKDGLNAAIDFIETGEENEEKPVEENEPKDEISSTVDVNFEDLGEEGDS